MNDNQVEIVALPEKHYIGVPVTVSFQRFDGDSIARANRVFLDRKQEIQGVVNEQEYVCPHFANDVLFTYIYCMEVAEIIDVPEGMVGFSVPAQQYGKVRSDDQDPYALIKNYLQANGLEINSSSLALEVFRFGEKQHVNNADIYVPVK